MGQAICVAGGGSWGTALAVLLAANGHAVRLYAREAEVVRGINETQRHPRRFPEVRLPDALSAYSELADALDGADSAYLVVPSEFLRALLDEHAAAWRDWLEGGGPAGRILCNCAKGLLSAPPGLPDEWLRARLAELSGSGAQRFALTHLAGPNLAAEIMAGSPAAAVVAGLPGQEQAARAVQAQLNCARYRVYTNSDPVGVEVAGFYKNIIAIAAGAVSELGLGHNTRAALLTRALAEMGRLVAHFGGSEQTLTGLAGVGDLIVTCSSPLSRNFRVGMLRAQGLRLEQIRERMDEVAEGINASRALRDWAADGAGGALPELPIAAEVYRILFEQADPAESLQRLMQRPPRGEN